MRVGRSAREQAPVRQIGAQLVGVDEPPCPDADADRRLDVGRRVIHEMGVSRGCAEQGQRVVQIGKDETAVMDAPLGLGSQFFPAIADIDADVRKEVDDATEACKAAPPPPLDIITTDVYADGGWAWRN